jgi:hypothetical protein
MVWTTLSQALLRGINKSIFVLLPVRGTGISTPLYATIQEVMQGEGGNRVQVVSVALSESLPPPKQP